jgi:hypothetical protein
MAEQVDDIYIFLSILSSQHQVLEPRSFKGPDVTHKVLSSYIVGKSTLRSRPSNETKQPSLQCCYLLPLPQIAFEDAGQGLTDVTMTPVNPFLESYQYFPGPLKGEEVACSDILLKSGKPIREYYIYTTDYFAVLLLVCAGV